MKAVQSKHQAFGTNHQEGLRFEELYDQLRRKKVMKKKAACLYLLLKISGVEAQGVGSDLFQSIFTQKQASKQPKYEAQKPMEVDRGGVKALRYQTSEVSEELLVRDLLYVF